MDSQDLTFEVRPSGDYLHIACMRCRTDCELDLKGRDAVMVKIEIKCPNCDTTGDWNSGVPELALPWQRQPSNHWGVR